MNLLHVSDTVQLIVNVGLHESTAGVFRKKNLSFSLKM